MSFDASSIAASVAKAKEVERSPSVTQRASEILQDQLASESAAAMSRMKTNSAEQIARARIRQERERKRRDLERHKLSSYPNYKNEDGPELDVVV